MSNPEGNRIPLFVGVFLVLVLVLASMAAGGSSSSTAPPPPTPTNARAVLLPGDGVVRTLVVPPCDASPRVRREAARGASLSGGVTVQVPAEDGAQRTALIPDCTKPPKGSSETAPPAAGVFVPPAGTAQLLDTAAQVGARSQVSVPAGSRAKIVVVPACVSGKQLPPAVPHQDVILSPAAGSSSAIAPRC